MIGALLWMMDSEEDEIFIAALRRSSQDEEGDYQKLFKDVIDAALKRSKKRKWKFERYSELYEKALPEWPEHMFVSRFRISRPMFNVLLELVKHTLTRQTTLMRSPIPPDKRLAVFLRYIATGAPTCILADSFGIGVSTARLVIEEVAEALNDVLPKPSFPKTIGEIEELSKGFTFPNTCGAIDGSHIPIVRPINDYDMYWCYKKFYSMVLMAAFGPRKELLYYDCSFGGRASDGGVFKDCGLKALVLKLPPEYHMLADSGFPLLTTLMTPYARSNTAPDDIKTFNYQLSSSRMVAECGFGELKERLRCLKNPMPFRDLKIVGDVISACCLLHNFWIANKDSAVEDACYVEMSDGSDSDSNDYDSNDSDSSDSDSSDYISCDDDSDAECDSDSVNSGDTDSSTEANSRESDSNSESDNSNNESDTTSCSNSTSHSSVQDVTLQVNAPAKRNYLKNCICSNA